mgnify:CR=1 FL=1|jgi:hypothetical protein
MLATKWLTKARELVKTDKGKACLEIHIRMDELYHAGEWEECKKIIDEIDAENDHFDIVVSMMVSSYAAKEELSPSRDNFYLAAYHRLSQKTV